MRNRVELIQPMVDERDSSGLCVRSRVFSTRVCVRSHPRLLIALCLLSACLSGCTGFIYNRLDDFAASYIEDLVTLSEHQSDALDHWLAQVQQWHRRSEITRYAQFVREFQRETAVPRTAAQYAAAGHEIESFWDSLVARTAPQGAQLLCALSATQADELMESLSERDEKERRKHAKLDDAERRERRVERIARFASRWIGSLSDAQQEIIERTVATLPLSEADNDSRAAWRAVLRAQLPQSTSGCPSVTAVETTLRHPERHWTPQYAREVELNREATVNMLAALDETLSTAQRERAQRKLADLATTLESLLEQES